MFLRLWNFLRGYVIIEVTGFSIERFLNMAARKGIYLWDVEQHGGKVVLKVSIKGFKMLKGSARKTKCRMKIVKKTGMPFISFKYRKRKILVWGILFFIAALYLLSSFIWVIEVEGNERISKEVLIQYCNEIGLKPGSFKYSIDTKKISNKFIEDFPELSWVSVNIKGTKAKISIVETIKKPEIVDRNTPCDVVAKRAGLITDVVVIGGTPAVKQKDVVQEGDVLVSGMLTILDGEEVKGYKYIHASAEVYAKVWYELEIEEPIEYIYKNYTDNKKNIYTVGFLNFDFDIINTGIPYDNYDKTTSVSRLNLGGDFDLPFSVTTNFYKEYIPTLMRHSNEEAINILNKKIDGIIEKKEEEDVTVFDKKVEFEVSEEKVTAKATVTIIERIDEQKEISQDIIDTYPEFKTEDET